MNSNFKPVPAWYLDAMREEITSKFYSDTTAWERFVIWWKWATRF